MHELAHGAPPPGWYPDRRAEGRYLFWDGYAWEIPGTAATTAVTTDSLIRPERYGRSTAVRVVGTIGLALAVYFCVFMMTTFGLSMISSLTGNPEPDLNAGLWVATGGYMLVFTSLAPKVSYRWFDVLWILVPIFGALWMIRILWRITNLPYRNWRPRPDEVSASGWTAHADLVQDAHGVGH